MKIHEYQAKEILRRYGVAVPEGRAVRAPEDAENVARDLGGDIVVVKSQIHAGGRGKGRFRGAVSEADLEKAARGEDAEGKGGVRLARSPADAREAAQEMLGQVLVTKQTGIEGQPVKRLYVESGCDIQRELYLGILLDRAQERVVVMASAEGGTEIEEVAEENPEAIHKVWVDPAVGLGGWQARKIAFALGLEGKSVRSAVKLMQGLYQAFQATDASMIEINPLVVTGAGDVMALDAKMTFDENALFRHKELLELRDLDEEDPAEVEAAKYHLSFIKLDGTIGCMVNGAGLAMATMDIIQYAGGEPANFLDVGGGANQEQVAAAFRIITGDPSVKAILVNIFGGIMKCDVIARGIIAAVEEVGLEVPLVVRLAGTNVELGKQILAESSLDVIPATTLGEAAEQAVRAVS